MRPIGRASTHRSLHRAEVTRALSIRGHGRVEVRIHRGGVEAAHPAELVLLLLLLRLLRLARLAGVVRGVRALASWRSLVLAASAAGHGSQPPTFFEPLVFWRCT